MDGLEATQRLRAQGVDTPIIALTAHAGAGDAERFLAAGMDGCLFKPVSKATLAKAFRQAFTAPHFS
jgi:CheY-like chemotaxis protein